MKKLILILGSFFLLVGFSTAQVCPTGNAATTGNAARFANGGQIYLEFATDAEALTVWTFLSVNGGSITLSGTAESTGNPVNVTIPVADLRRPAGNPFRIRSNIVIENGGGNFTGTVTFNLGTSTLECVYVDGVYQVAMPIELLSFEAKKMEGAISLDWQTASEIDNDYMAVERSKDGRYFEEIGRKTGAGYSESLQHYQLIDKKPLNGLNYYRLKQVDFDGTESYSDVVQESFKEKNNLNIYPTLIDGTDELNIDLSSFSTGDIQLAIYNMNGQLIQQYQSGGAEQMTILVSDFENGFYMLKVVHDQHMTTARFLKIR